MGVDVQRHADVRMTHDILQCLRVHSGFRHIGTEGVSAYMRGYFGHLDAVDLVVLLDNVLQVFLPMQRNHRSVILVQEQEAGISIHHRLHFRCHTIGENTAETRYHFLTHRHIADTAFRLGVLDHILHLRCSLQLVVNLDTLLIELDIRKGQSTKFRDTQPRIKENEDRIVVSAEVLIFFNEFQKFTLLLSGKVLDMDMLREIKREFPDAIIGQSVAQRQTIGTLYDVAKGRFNKPCVMLFYGNTGIGKTETAKYIAEKLNERLFRKQFSMLHSEEFTSYLFGGKHNQNSFAKELLERESNVILLDEFDKPNPVFYSAFYQLFDEGVFADKNYTVTMKNAIIICTSNFLSEDQIRERLGDPIYSRFDAVIHFTDLQPDAVQKLLDREIERQYTKLDTEEQAIIDSRKIVPLLKQNAHRLSNARQIKKFVREAFSAAITDAVL